MRFFLSASFAAVEMCNTHGNLSIMLNIGIDVDWGVYVFAFSLHLYISDLIFQLLLYILCKQKNINKKLK